MSIIKTCATCTIEIYGRKDKIFCSKKCQNQHHKITREDTKAIQCRNFNKAIKRNFVVLRGALSFKSDKVIVHRNNLEKNGFKFRHFLKKRRQDGQDVYRIKEFEFRDVGYGKIEITRLKKGAPYSPEFIDRWSREFSLDNGVINVDFEEGSKEHFEGDVYYYFERISNYLEKCIVARATNLLRLQKEMNTLNSQPT